MARTQTFIPNRDPVDAQMICETDPQRPVSPIVEQAKQVVATVSAPVVSVAKALTDVATGRKDEIDEIPPPKRFVVTRGGQIASGRMRVSMPAGKIVTSQVYDIEDLRKQGIRLRELAEGEDLSGDDL